MAKDRSTKALTHPQFYSEFYFDELDVSGCVHCTWDIKATNIQKNFFDVWDEVLKDLSLTLQNDLKTESGVKLSKCIRFPASLHYPDKKRQLHIYI